MSKKLRNLLKQNRNLEQKIFYDTKDSDWREEMIVSQELSDALTQLYHDIVESTNPQVSFLHQLNQLDNLSGRPLDAFEKNALQVVELIFNYLREYGEFSPAFVKLLNRLQIAYTRLSLNDLSYVDNPKHPAVSLLTQLIEIASLFHEKSGKPANNFAKASVMLIEKLSTYDQVTTSLIDKAGTKLADYAEAYQQKIETNANKIRQQIEQESRKAQADIYTQKLINDKTQNEEMPIFLLDFFENLLKPILHQTIATNGVNSKQTQQLLTDMDTLIWSITCPYGDPDYNDRYQADVPPAMKRLYQRFEESSRLDSYVKEFFIETEDFHMKKLQGQRIQYDVMISADIFADEGYDSNELVHWYDKKDGTFFDIESLKEGGWYRIVNGDTNETFHCRLLIVSELTKALYFVNASNELVVTVSFEDTQFLANNLEYLGDTDPISFQHALNFLERELSARLEVLKGEYELLLKQRARDKEEKHRQEVAAREAIQKRIEEEKRQEIIRRQEALKREAERLAEEKRLEELDARQRFHIKGIYRKLAPGVVIAFKNDAGRWVEATLTLISSTTNKHIFNDSKGNKILEPTKDELLDLIGENRLKVLNESSVNRDPITALVRDRRQKLQGS